MYFFYLVEFAQALRWNLHKHSGTTHTAHLRELIRYYVQTYLGLNCGVQKYSRLLPTLTVAVCG